MELHRLIIMCVKSASLGMAEMREQGVNMVACADACLPWDMLGYGASWRKWVLRKP